MNNPSCLSWNAEKQCNRGEGRSLPHYSGQRTSISRETIDPLSGLLGVETIIGIRHNLEHESAICALVREHEVRPRSEGEARSSTTIHLNGHLPTLQIL